MDQSEKTDYERIEELAFRIYEEEGCPEGHAKEHWARAERALELLHHAPTHARDASSRHSP